MKRSSVIVPLLVSSVLLIFSMTVSAQSKQPPLTAVPGFYDNLDKNTVSLRRGEALFYQNCSFCHLPRIRKARTTPGPGPSLTGVLQGADKARETRVRDYILMGSDKMPAWRYTFKPAQIDDLITYLKTL
jgi:mono/diheme cytochrome c family protein